MGEFVKILMVILISSVKFVVGPAFAYYDEKYDFTIFEAIVYPIIGGMLGVFVFSFFSDQVANVWHWIKNRIKKTVSRKQPFTEPTIDSDGKVVVNYTYVDAKEKPKNKIFTKRNRRIVTIWSNKPIEINFALLIPATIGRVLQPNSLSPSISSISLITSLTNEIRNAKNAYAAVIAIINLRL